MKRILLFFMVLTSAFTSTWADVVSGKAYALQSKADESLYLNMDQTTTFKSSDMSALFKQVVLSETPSVVLFETSGTGFTITSTQSGEYLDCAKWSVYSSTTDKVWYVSEGTSGLTLSQDNTKLIGFDAIAENAKAYADKGTSNSPYFTKIPYVKVVYNYQLADKTPVGTSISYLKAGDAYPEAGLVGCTIKSEGPSGTVSATDAELVEKTFDITVTVNFNLSETYRLKNVATNHYLTAYNVGTSYKPAATTLDESSDLQKWQLVADGATIALKNVGTDTYIQEITGNTEHAMTSTPFYFAMGQTSPSGRTTAVDGEYCFYTSGSSDPRNYLFEDGSTYTTDVYRILGWIANNKEFWTLEVVTTTTPPTPTTSYTINYVNAADESVLYTTTKEFADGTEPTAAVMGWFGWTQGTQTVSDATKTITVPMTNLLGNRKWRVYTTDGVTNCYMKLASTNPENPTSGTPTPLSLTTKANASMFVFAPNVANEYGPEWSLQDIETEKYLGYDKWDSKAYDVAYNWTVILAEENSFYMYQPGTVDGNVSDKGRGYIGLEKNTDSPSTNYNAIYTNKTYDGANPVGSASDSTDPNTALKFYLEEVISVDVTMHKVGSNYYATACYPFALKTDANNTEAYYVTSRLSEDYLGVEKANVIPAGEAVLLVSTGGTAKLTLTDDAPDAVTNNIMAGTYFEKEITADDYVLGKYNDEVGFWHTSVLTLSAHKGYIPQANLPAASNGMAIRFGNLTAIENIQTGSNSVVYDLQGRRVATPVSGQLYIANGKKYIQK